MKRVETIHINGIIFSIEDDAYNTLSAYISALSNYFKNEQGGNEIIADIEARIAELLAGRSGGNAAVVALADVSRIITVLGTPEDIAGSDSDVKPEMPSETPQQEKSSGKLYRDPDKRYLGGVCAGIANRMDISPLVLRLAFVAAVFFWGVSAVAYLCLWIVIPLAKTTAQKLEMCGQPVTVSNIKKNIRENRAVSSVEHLFGQFMTEAGELCKKMFKTLINISGVCIGIALALAGTGILLLAGSLLLFQDLIFGHAIEWDWFSFAELLQHVVSPVSYLILHICGCIIVFLPVAACLFWGIRLMRGFTVKGRFVHVLLLLVWLSGMVVLTLAGIFEARNFAWHNGIKETTTLPSADTLYLEAMPAMKISNNPLDMYYDKETGRFYGKPTLMIRKSEDGKTGLVINRESQGKTKIDAYRHAENIGYHVDVRDSLLLFPSFFTVQPENQWKFQYLNMILYVPEGTVIAANETLCGDLMFKRRRFSGCKWIMTGHDGLQLLQQ
ncbi:MAG: PspC domain-containing protein [Bacteroidales bacterium]|jgi:phage shock protein PspC (stress-responsive transcriptional regulator)|nr:PspC domain-containing protein [Bacteroidales bacterium]